MEDEAKAREPKAKVQASMPEGWPPVIGMTLEETAAALRIDPKTAQSLISTKGLPARLCGKGWRVSPKALDEWLASGTGEGRKPPMTGDKRQRLFPSVPETENENEAKSK